MISALPGPTIWPLQLELRYWPCRPRSAEPREYASNHRLHTGKMTSSGRRVIYHWSQLLDHEVNHVWVANWYRRLDARQWTLGNSTPWIVIIGPQAH